MQYAPIAFFAYKRLWHTQQAIASLQNNSLAKVSDLYIYSDGPKDLESATEVAALRAWLPSIEGFKKVEIIEHPHNLGLARSIISGVSECLERFGKVIVVEDDLIVAPHFLSYMNEALELYQEDELVVSIHGYALPIKEPLPPTYFLKGTDCWGWATWKRAWEVFEKDGAKLLAKLKEQGRLKEFDYNGTQKFSQMLEDQIAGKNNSWAIRWHASAFLHDMLTLFPAKSLVCNIGFDGSGEHCGSHDLLKTDLSYEPIDLQRIPIKANDHAFAAHVRFFKALREPLYKKILRRTKKLINLLINTRQKSKLSNSAVKGE